MSAAAAPSVSSLQQAASPYLQSANKLYGPHAKVAYERGSQYASQAYKVGFSRFISLLSALGGLPHCSLPTSCSQQISVTLLRSGSRIL